MSLLGRIAGLLLLAVLSAAALLFLLPGLTEGFDTTDLPRLGLGAAVLLALDSSGHRFRVGVEFVDGLL